ncbi:MAG: PAS domain S-box protein [Myxococcota bacterium]
MEQLARYKYALDQASIVAVTDVKGTITYANDKFCDISKYSRDELLGQDHRILNSGLHPKAYIRDLWRTIGQGQVWRGEFRNKAKDGSFYWVDTTIVPFLDHRGKPEEYLAIRNDITQKKLIQSQLRAKETMAQLGQMAAVIAHEVKNPLAGISGALQVISKRLPTSPESKVLGDVVARIAELDEVLAGLLDFARPRAPKLRECHVRELLEQPAALLASHPSHQHVTFSVVGGDPIVLVDPALIGRAIFNLILNAAQALEGHADAAQPAAIRVELSETEDDVAIAVVDNGPGLAPGVFDELFKPFVTTKIAGTGLGLAIAKQTVEAHGGRIEASSRQGHTVFRVLLPRRRIHPV